MFSNDDELAEKLIAAGKATGEKLWRMPLGEAYDKQIKSEIADMKNIGGRPGGSITAAQFIQRFVNDKPWAHLDIAGMAWATQGRRIAPKGATAFGVRLLDRLVAQHYEADAERPDAKGLMTEIGFYHLTRTGLTQALPQLLARTLAAGQRAVVLCRDAARVAALDPALWECAEPDWLPHGTAADGDAELQPIWLATDDAAPNGARFLFLVDGADSARLAAFDAGVRSVRRQRRAGGRRRRATRWSAAKAAGHALTYWQQGPRGWEKKA